MLDIVAIRRRRVASSKSRKPSRTRRARHGLRLELLEDRRVLAPLVDVPGAQSVVPNAASPIAGIFMSDPSVTGQTVEIELNAGNGNLTIVSPGSATVTNNGATNVSIRGTLTEVNQAVASLQYESIGAFLGADAITVTGSDLGHGLAAHWKMDETVAGPVVDSAGQGRDGTNSGAQLGEPGQIGPSYLFAPNDFISIPGWAGITGTDPRSMAAWVRTTNSGNHSIISWGTNSGGQKWNFRVQNSNGTAGAIRVEVNGGYIVSQDSVADGNWHHVAATWENDGTPDVNDVKLYIDGAPQSNSAVQARAINTATNRDVWIGRDFGNRYFDGNMDDAAVWNRVLSSEEIAALAVSATGAGPFTDVQIIPIAVGISPPVAGDDNYATSSNTVLSVPALGVLANDVNPDPGVTDGAALNFDAGQDDGANTTWENTGGTAGFDITGLTGHTYNTHPLTTRPGIKASYSFDGAGGGVLATLDNQGNGQNASFELWIRPSDLSGNETIFETGGGNGIGIVLEDANLTFSVAQDSGGDRTSRVSQDLTATGIDDFIQVVGVFDIANDEVTLYVNGQQVGSAAAVGDITDWTGGDGAGIARLGASNQGGYGNGAQGFTNYEGEIAILRFYQNKLLSAGEVQDNYNAIANSLAVTGVDSASALGAAISISGNGAFTYDPTNTLVLAQGETAVDTFHYTIESLDGVTDTGTVTIQVTGANSNPLAGDDSFLTDEDTPLTSGGGYLETVLSQSPIGYWRLGEQNGTTAENIGSLGATANGTYQGGTLGQPGAIAGGDTATGFNGSTDQVLMSGFKGVTGVSPRSGSAWIKTTSLNGGILAWGTDATSLKWIFRTQNNNGQAGAIRVEVSGGYSVGNTVVTDDQWHHVAFTFQDDGTPDVQDVKLYVDGQLDAEFGGAVAPSASQATAINTASGIDVLIGNDHSNRHLGGLIDEVALFDRVLSPAEIQAQFAARIGAPSLLANDQDPDGGRTVAPGAALNFDAGADDGANDTWENTGATAGFNITGLSGRTYVANPSTSLPGIGGAYDFDGSGGGDLTSLHNQGDTQNASFEIWFRPRDLSGNETIFETGGGTGVGIVLEGSNATFSVTQNSGGTQTARISYDLGGIDASEFIQLVGAFDIASDTATLYINGEQVGAATAAANITDWTGTDGAGLARLGAANQGGFGGGAQGFTNFDGEIAIFRFYQDRLLSQNEVVGNYHAVRDDLRIIANAASSLGAAVSIDADGSFSYDHTQLFGYLTSGETVTDTFSYTISDNNGGADTATITVRITGMNDPPTAVDDDGGVTDEETPLIVPPPGVLANDLDPDALPLEGATLNYDAALDNDGDNLWQNTVAAGREWDFGGGGVVRNPNPATTRHRLTASYVFDGSGGGAATSFDAFSLQPGSLEIWFKPESLNGGKQILFETGGGTGTSFSLEDNLLTFRSLNAGQAVAVTTDITGLESDFIQAVGTIDPNGSPRQAKLFVNGQLIGQETNPNGPTDWSGSDGAGLGTLGQANMGGFGAGDQGFGSFTGEIAILRFYEFLIHEHQVQHNFDAVSNPRPLFIRSNDAVTTQGGTVEMSSAAIGDSGVVSGVDEVPVTVTLSRSFANPVVFAQPLSNTGADAAVIRITDLQADRFTIQLIEPPNLDGTHGLETVSYVVIEAGQYQLADGTRMEVGLLDTAATAGGAATAFATVTFAQPFTATPVVISQVQSFNDTNFVKTRQRNASPGSVEVALEEYESATLDHSMETIGYLAIEASTGEMGGRPIAAGNTAASVIETAFPIAFGADLGPSPVFIASIATYNGGDPSGLRYVDGSLSGTGVQVYVDEDTSQDAEVGHAAEVVSYLAIGGSGPIAVAPSGSGFGGFTYTPGGGLDHLAAGDSVTDTFTYTLSDSGGATDTATVTLQVSGANDAPTAVMDSFSTDEDTLLTGNVLANDFDVDDQPVAMATMDFDANQDSDATDGWQDAGTGAGAWTFTGGVTHTASPATALPGIQGAFVFDGSGGGTMTSFDAFSTQPASFEIWFKPDSLTGGPQILWETGGGTGTSFSLTDNVLTFRSLNGGQAVEVSADLSGVASDFIQVVGAVDPNANPRVAELYVNGQLVGSDTNGSGPTDWSGGDAAGLATLGGSNMGGFGNGNQGFGNFAGEIAGFRFFENRTLTAGDVQDYYRTVAEPPQLAGFDATSQLGASVQMTADGTFSYDPRGVLDYLTIGQTQVDRFSYSIQDSAGLTATGSVSIVVSGVNDAPTAVADTATTDEETVLTVDPPGVLANDTDVDILQTGGATLNYDAKFDVDGDAVWQNLASATGRDWSFSATGVTYNSDPSSSLPGIRAAFEFDGSGGGSSTSYDAFSTNPATVEIWFKPDSLNGGPQILWETGGGTGSSLSLTDGTLTFRALASGEAVETSYDISALASDFIQVVATVDPTSTPREAHLFVNGQQVASDSNPAGPTDWSGSDGAGLGMLGQANMGGFGGGDQGFSAFRGQIAIFRFYEMELTSAEITRNYAAVAGGNTELQVTAFDAVSARGGLVSMSLPVEMGEVGTITSLNQNPQTITLSRSYTNPVVIAQPLTDAEADHAVARISNVASNQFTIQLQESPELDGAHADEIVHYLVLEAGNWQLPGGLLLEAGQLTTNATTNGAGGTGPEVFAAVNFSSPFEAAPVVVSQVQSMNQVDFVKTRQRDATATGFLVALEEEEVAADDHDFETIGYVAVAAGLSASNGMLWEAGNTPNIVTEAVYSIDFAYDLGGQPSFLGAIATHDGVDSSALRIVDGILSGQGVQVYVQEDQSQDAELGHGDEVISYLAVGGAGVLTALPQGTSSGGFQYDPNGRFENLGLGQTATDTFRYTITDGHGSTSSGAVTLTIEGVNDAPTADAGGPYASAEGDSLTLDGSASSDIDDGDVLSYRWDLNGDGDFGDAVGVNPTVAWNTLQTLLPAIDGPSEYPIAVEVSDGLASPVVAETTLSVTNTAPVASVVGPSEAVPNQQIAFALTALDASQADNAAGFTFQVDWGDGESSVAGPGQASPLLLSHAFQRFGSYTVSLTATDKDGGVSSIAEHVVEIKPVVQVGDDVFAGGTDEVSDRIIVSKAGLGSVYVVYNSTRYGRFDLTPASVVSILGGDGNDRITISACVQTEIHGEEGNDYIAGGPCNDSITGGPGRDYLLTGDGDNLVDGGEGNDRLIARAGNDILLGGAGNDRIIGGSGGDNLRGGSGNDQITAGDGDDLLDGGSGNDQLTGGYGDDVLLGGGGIDLLRGDFGNDLMVGGEGRDQLAGLRGQDVLTGGSATGEEDDAALLAVWAAWSGAADRSPLGQFRDDAEQDGLNGGGGEDELYVGADDVLSLLRASDIVLLL